MVNVTLIKTLDDTGVKMKKRKYNKTGKYAKVQSDAPQSSTEPLKEGNNIIVPKELNEAQIQEFKKDTGKLNKGFTFDDLPLSIRTQVERDILYRKRLNLFDDSKERKERAVKYFLGDEPR
jgi:hypothetical protein